MLNLKTVATFLCLFLSISAYAEDKLIVFAAASLTNALSEIDNQFEKEHGLKVSHSFASSATLAKQIENGAPADVFISADIKWMNYLHDKSFINKHCGTVVLNEQMPSAFIKTAALHFFTTAGNL